MEIERKFLVEEKSSPKLEILEKYELEQYYISIEPEIRFRKVCSEKIESKYFLTFKSSGDKIRKEIEIEINEEIFENNKNKIIGSIVSKDRTIIILDSNLKAELDNYDFINLVVVEVEFETEEEADNFIPPEWFGKEVTNDKRYKNKYLAKIQV